LYAPDVFLFTANNVIKKDGSLVMGAGTAKEVQDAWPKVSLMLGQKIQKFGNNDYHVVTTTIQKGQVIGAFQTKRNYKHISSYDIIHKSTQSLKKIASKYPQFRYHLNFPGIGYGKLDYEKVFDIINVLPDNVLIYYVTIKQ
jgi:hypothetical protein